MEETIYEKTLAPGDGVTLAIKIKVAKFLAGYVVFYTGGAGAVLLLEFMDDKNNAIEWAVTQSQSDQRVIEQIASEVEP
jgi:hypothetical protein